MNTPDHWVVLTYDRNSGEFLADLTGPSLLLQRTTKHGAPLKYSGRDEYPTIYIVGNELSWSIGSQYYQPDTQCQYIPGQLGLQGTALGHEILILPQYFPSEEYTTREMNKKSVIIQKGAADYYVGAWLVMEGHKVVDVLQREFIHCKGPFSLVYSGSEGILEVKAIGSDYLAVAGEGFSVSKSNDGRNFKVRSATKEYFVQQMGR